MGGASGALVVMALRAGPGLSKCTGRTPGILDRLRVFSQTTPFFKGPILRPSRPSSSQGEAHSYRLDDPRGGATSGCGSTANITSYVLRLILYRARQRSVGRFDQAYDDRRWSLPALPRLGRLPVAV